MDDLSLQEIEKRLDESPRVSRNEERALGSENPENGSRIITCGPNDRRGHDIEFPSTTLFQLHSPSGFMDIGWGSQSVFDAFGERQDTGEVYQADSGFRFQGINKFCLVAYESFSGVIAYVNREFHWGCSVMKTQDHYYTLQIGGVSLYTIINDENVDNDGEFRCTLEWWSSRPFYENLRKERLAK